MSEKKSPSIPPHPLDPAVDPMAPTELVVEAFAALAVEVVIKEKAELPVLSVLADPKVRPRPNL